MAGTRLLIDHNFTVSEVNPRLFGSFVEHLGRCVYDGIYEPGHPEADQDGFRRDVIDLVKELGVSAIRYPGGNFVSGYRWEDGVGPKDERPSRLDLAWHSIESNHVGLDEFASWTTTVGSEMMLALNLGTRGLESALDLIEYSNVRSGTRLSDQRIANGSPEPHDVKIWCLGNEMDGPWQTGHLNADDYGKLAAQVAASMKQVDGRIELVACGSSNRAMPTFGAWERTVLEHSYELVDLISCHAYYEEHDGDLPSFLASAVDMDRFIEGVVATIDHVKAVKRSEKTVNISFDEWNIWYHSRYAQDLRPTDVDGWESAPRLLEDVYSVADAVAFGGLLISLLRHADRVKAASLAQLVNVIAPIMTEPGGPAWRQTTFFPFAQASALGRGDVLQVKIESPVHDTNRYGQVTAVDAVATYDAERNSTTFFLVNRSVDEVEQVEMVIAGDFAPVGVVATTLSDADVYAKNTLDDPERISPHSNESVTTQAGTIRILLPPVSWTVVEVAHKER